MAGILFINSGFPEAKRQSLAEHKWAEQSQAGQLQPVSCNFQHNWAQRCSVFKRALNLSTHPRATHASSLCSCTVDPIQPTGWVGAVNRESATDLLPQSFHVSLCAVSHCSDSRSKIPCWKLHETGCGLLFTLSFTFIFEIVNNLPVGALFLHSTIRT